MGSRVGNGFRVRAKIGNIVGSVADSYNGHCPVWVKVNHRVRDRVRERGDMTRERKLLNWSWCVRWRIQNFVVKSDFPNNLPTICAKLL